MRSFLLSGMLTHGIGVAAIAVFPLWAAADYDLGLQAYQRGEYDKAYGEWMDVVMSPPENIQPALMAETCYALGMLFWVGQGVAQSTATSARWLLRAANLGHPGAQTKLGYLYGSGQGVVQSDFEAFKWTQMAANQGDVDAQYNLGVFYRDGQGVTIDTEQALQWFREAASNGDQVSADVVSNYERFGWPVSDGSEVSEPVAISNAVQVQNIAELDSDSIAELNSRPNRGPVTIAGNSDAEVVLDVTAAMEVESALGDIVDVEEGGDSGLADQPVASSDQQLILGALDEPKKALPGVEYLDEEWLQQRDPGHYTIQIIALLDPARLQTFIDAYPQLQPFALYEQKLKGKPLWVLVQGDYADIEQARTAAADFPTDIQDRDQLWIRRFSMVQSLLQ